MSEAKTDIMGLCLEAYEAVRFEINVAGEIY